jgi:hypothetical protein
MTKQDVIDHFGGVVKAAKALGYKSRGTVSAWPDDLPYKTQAYVQAITNGKLKADKPSKCAG